MRSPKISSSCAFLALAGIMLVIAGADANSQEAELTLRQQDGGYALINSGVPALSIQHVVVNKKAGDPECDFFPVSSGSDYIGLSNEVWLKVILISFPDSKRVNEVKIETGQSLNFSPQNCGKVIFIDVIAESGAFSWKLSP
jgi:hypothetical protein